MKELGQQHPGIFTFYSKLKGTLQLNKKKNIPEKEEQCKQLDISGDRVSITGMKKISR